MTLPNAELKIPREDNALPRRARAFLDLLIRNGAALRWRRNGWDMLSGPGSTLAPVSTYQNGMIKRLAALGALAASEDGLLRPAGFAARVVHDANESPLNRLAAERKQEKLRLDAAQLRAGEQLRADFEAAQFAPKVTATYKENGGSGNFHWRMSDNAIEQLSDAAIAARQRLHAALTAVGPELSGILLHVCCLLSGLEEAERQLTLPRRSGKTVLSLALTRLARFYRLKPVPPDTTTRRASHWAMPDYRPSLKPSAPLPHLP